MGICSSLLLLQKFYSVVQKRAVIGHCLARLRMPKELAGCLVRQGCCASKVQIQYGRDYFLSRDIMAVAGTEFVTQLGHCRCNVVASTSGPLWVLPRT